MLCSFIGEDAPSPTELLGMTTAGPKGNSCRKPDQIWPNETLEEDQLRARSLSRARMVSGVLLGRGHSGNKPHAESHLPLSERLVE